MYVSYKIKFYMVQKLSRFLLKSYKNGIGFMCVIKTQVNFAKHKNLVDFCKLSYKD